MTATTTPTTQLANKQRQTNKQAQQLQKQRRIYIIYISSQAILNCKMWI